MKYEDELNGGCEDKNDDNLKNLNTNQVFGRGANAGHSDNMAEALKEKIEEIENLFRIKEEKMKENYEETILNLEGRLEKEQERFKEQSQREKNEKEAT